MKVAVIGSRKLKNVPIGDFLPEGISVIVSGGAKGVDTTAEQYADQNNIPKQIFLPDYKMYGKIAPLIRNREIVNCADFVLAFWDGKSCGTLFTAKYAKEQNKQVALYLVEKSKKDTIIKPVPYQENNIAKSLYSKLIDEKNL